MKKFFASFSILIALSSSAQISILRSDYGSIGDKVRFAVDTPLSNTLNSTVLLSGANQTWDFSTGLNINKYDSNVFVSPAIAVTPPDSANLLILSASGRQFENVDSDFVRLILDRPTYNIKNIIIKIVQFPITYNSVLIDSINYTKSGTPADFNVGVLSSFGYDSVKAVIKAFDSTSCLGWGSLNLPDTSVNVLKVKIAAESNIYLYGHNAFTGWALINSLAGIPIHQKSLEYQWIGKNSKSYVARAIMDSNGIVASSFIYRIRKMSVPKINLITPNSGTRFNTSNDTISVTINTSNSRFTLSSNISVSLIQGNNSMLIDPVNVVNDTTLTAKVIIQTSDAIGQYLLQVKDPIFGYFTLANAFQVIASTGINESQINSASITVFPNPANDVLTISISQQTISPITISIYDITGRLMNAVKTNKNNTSIDVSNLNNGIYFINITGSDFNTSRKISINK